MKNNHGNNIEYLLPSCLRTKSALSKWLRFWALVLYSVRPFPFWHRPSRPSGPGKLGESPYPCTASLPGIQSCDYTMGCWATTSCAIANGTTLVFASAILACKIRYKQGVSPGQGRKAGCPFFNLPEIIHSLLAAPYLARFLSKKSSTSFLNWIRLGLLI